MNIYQRLAAVMGDVDYVQKEKKAGMRYSIVSHDAVTAKVRPVLVKHGIVYHPVGIQASQDGNRTQVQLTVRFASVDDPKDYIDVPSLGYGIDDQDKGPGKAISYAVKYAVLKTLGLETGDDPDEDQETEHKPKPKVEMYGGTGDAREVYRRIYEAIANAANARTIDGILSHQKADIDGLPSAGRDGLYALAARRKTDLAGKEAA